MSTYSQCLHHVVFAPKHRRPALVAAHRRELFAYMNGIVKRLRFHLYRLNGVDDHVHFLVGLHPDVAPATFVQKIKLGSGNWMRKGGLFPDFDNWQEGYAVFTKSWRDKDTMIEYVKNQEEHHRHESFIDELRRLVEEAGLEWDDRYLP